MARTQAETLECVVEANDRIQRLPDVVELGMRRVASNAARAFRRPAA